MSWCHWLNVVLAVVVLFEAMTLGGVYLRIMRECEQRGHAWERDDDDGEWLRCDRCSRKQRAVSSDI